MNEFLFRWPGGKHLLNLLELEKRMDQIMADQFKAESDIMDNIMVEVYDAAILRRGNPQVATLGKMSVSSAVQKFQ